MRHPCLVLETVFKMSSMARRKTRRSVSRKQSTDTLVSQRPLTLETVENVISKLKDPKGATINAILLPLQTTNPGVPVDELKALLKAVLLEGLDSGRLIRPPGSKARRGLVGRFLLKATDSADSSLENAAETLVNTAKLMGVPEIDCVGHDNVVDGATKELRTSEVEGSRKGEVTKKTQKKRGQRRRKSVAKASEDHITSSDGHDISKTETDKEDKSEELQVQEDVKLRTRRSKKDTVQPTRSTAPRGKRGRKPAKTVTAVETVTTEDDATEHQIERKVKEEENGVPEEERASEKQTDSVVAAQDSTGVKEDPPSDLNGTFVLESSSSPAAYLQRVQEERERLAGRCLDVEKYLRWKVPSNVLERVRSAIGQSTLITTNEKSTMARFEAQCREAMAPEGDNLYRPTMNDLEAYWDLVELQVKNIDQLFDRVHVMVKREAV